MILSFNAFARAFSSTTGPRELFTKYAVDFIAQKWEEWMPRGPFLFAYQPLALPHLSREHAHHEKCELSRRFGQHIGCVRKRDFVFVRCRAIDVVEADRNLCHDLQRPLPR